MTARTAGLLASVALAAVLLAPAPAGAQSAKPDAAKSATAAAPVAPSTGVAPLGGPRDGTNDPVLAVVDGLPIRRSEMLEAARGMPQDVQQLPFEMVYPLIVDRLIDIKLVASLGRQAKLDQDPEVKRRVAEATERAIQEIYLTRYVQSQITEDGLKQRHAALIAKNPNPREIKVRHILVGSQERAMELLKRAVGGEDFAKLARDFSIGPEASKGGELGWVGDRDLSPNFRKAAFAGAKGEVLRQPVRSEFGWHVIKIEDERKVPPPSFAEAKDRLTQEWSTEIIQALMEKTRKTASIQRFDYAPTEEERKRAAERRAAAAKAKEAAGAAAAPAGNPSVAPPAGAPPAGAPPAPPAAPAPDAKPATEAKPTDDGKPKLIPLVAPIPPAADAPAKPADAKN